MAKTVWAACDFDADQWEVWLDGELVPCPVRADAVARIVVCYLVTPNEPSRLAFYLSPDHPAEQLLLTVVGEVTLRPVAS